MANPAGFVLKKHMAQILQDKYPQHEEVINRISAVFLTEKDIQSFANMIGAVYETAYMKSVNDHRKILLDLGYKVNVGSTQQEVT
jgi:hypothetical protein